MDPLLELITQKNKPSQSAEDYAHWQKIRVEEYASYLGNLEKNLTALDLPLRDLLLRFNRIDSQFTIPRACSGYLNRQGGLASFQVPLLHLYNDPVGYGLAFAPLEMEYLKFHKLDRLLCGIAEQLGYGFNEKVLEIKKEYPDETYDMDGMPSEVIYNFWILKPEHGFKILEGLWGEFEKIVDFYDKQGTGKVFKESEFRLTESNIVAVKREGFREKLVAGSL